MHRTGWPSFAAAVIFAIGAGAATAQDGPAELPPEGFAGASYVDSTGCAFSRVSIGGRTDWVPRVGADRQPVCGLSPTAAAEVEARIEVAPNPVVTPVPAVATPRQVRQAAPQPVNHARAQSGAPVLVIIPPNLHIAGAVAVDCPAVGGAAAAYLDRPGVTCALVDGVPRGPHAARITRLDLRNVPFPDGYRRAWEDGRLNPYQGVRTVEGEVQMRQIWTDTVPRRLVSPD